MTAVNIYKNVSYDLAGLVRIKYLFKDNNGLDLVFPTGPFEKVVANTFSD